MKKVLIALDNVKLFEDINKKMKYEIYEQDIVYKEGVLEYISKNPIDILITRDDLNGDMIKEIYIKQIKLLNPNIKIILFVKDVSDNYLQFLYNTGIFDVIQEKDNISINSILDMIEGKRVEKKVQNNINIIQNKKINIITKKKIAVFGTDGSGKSYVSSLIASMISKKLNMKTLLIDFDLQSPAIDIYNNLNCNNNMLMDIVKYVDNETLNSEIFDNIVYKKDRMGYITNNISIFECQNNISAKHCEKIYEIASQKYDIIISDIVANIYFDITYNNIKNADVLIFVISPNYISIRQAVKYLDLITNVWNIDRSKICLVINKITNNSLSVSQIESLIPGYRIVMQINYDFNIENVINGISNLNENLVKEDGEIYKIFGIENNDVDNCKNNMKKNNFLYNLFRKEERI